MTSWSSATSRNSCRLEPRRARAQRSRRRCSHRAPATPWGASAAIPGRGLHPALPSRHPRRSCRRLQLDQTARSGPADPSRQQYLSRPLAPVDLVLLARRPGPGPPGGPACPARLGPSWPGGPVWEWQGEKDSPPFCKGRCRVVFDLVQTCACHDGMARGRGRHGGRAAAPTGSGVATFTRWRSRHGAG